MGPAPMVALCVPPPSALTFTAQTTHQLRHYTREVLSRYVCTTRASAKWFLLRLVRLGSWRVQTVNHVRHPSSQRSSPGGASPQRKSKRPPLPVFGSSNSNSSPPKKSLKVCTACLQEWSWLHDECFITF